MHEKMAASDYLDTEEVTLRLVPVEGPAGPPVDALPSSANELLPEEKAILSAVLRDGVDLAKVTITTQQLQTIRNFRNMASRAVAEDFRLIDGSAPTSVSDPQPSCFGK